VRVKAEQTCGAAVSHGCSRNFLWCSRCGAHAARRVQDLTHECVGKPKHNAYRKVRSNLAQGLEPTSKRQHQWLGTPIRFTLHEWLNFRANSLGTPVPPADSKHFADLLDRTFAQQWLSFTAGLEPSLQDMLADDEQRQDVEASESD